MSCVELAAGREALLSKSIAASLDLAARDILVLRGKLSCCKPESVSSCVRFSAGLVKATYAVLESWKFEIVVSKLVAVAIRSLLLPAPLGKASHHGVCGLVHSKIAA